MSTEKSYHNLPAPSARPPSITEALGRPEKIVHELSGLLDQLRERLGPVLGDPEASEEPPKPLHTGSEIFQALVMAGTRCPQERRKDKPYRIELTGHGAQGRVTHNGARLSVMAVYIVVRADNPTEVWVRLPAHKCDITFDTDTPPLVPLPSEEGAARSESRAEAEPV